MLITGEEARYPEEGDKLFVEEGLPDDLAWLNGIFNNLGSHADSYQNGALTLIDASLTARHLRNYNVYPAVFLVRHYFELRLKELIQGLNYIHDQNRDFKKSHNLLHLWHDFILIYSELGEDINSKEIQLTHMLLKEISSIDPTSMAYRYPVDRNGVEIQKLEYINLRNFREIFVRVCFVFDGISMLIASKVELTEDLVREMRSNYW